MLKCNRDWAGRNLALKIVLLTFVSISRYHISLFPIAI